MAALYTLMLLTFWVGLLQLVQAAQTSLPVRRITGKFVFPSRRNNGGDKLDQKLV
jgi:hypothetical protein